MPENRTHLTKFTDSIAQNYTDEIDKRAPPALKEALEILKSRLRTMKHNSRGGQPGRFEAAVNKIQTDFQNINNNRIESMEYKDPIAKGRLRKMQKEWDDAYKSYTQSRTVAPQVGLPSSETRAK
ncbi:MAG: hypothetical protein M1821_007308 [Bathelium mastoideum]|nr:MAG: hypothetical protein M1821_007308 [Bathelium mastoideum]